MLLRTLDALVFVVLAVMFFYISAFAFVGACLVASTQEVSQCRNNVAGEIVYRSVSMFL